MAHQVGTLGLCAAALFMLAAGTAEANEPVGAERCGSCHQAEYAQWKTTAHAQALSRLTASQQQDAACRSCHTTAPRSKDARFSGVQCESCHGEGNYYAPSHIMKDKKLAAILGLEKVTEKTCQSCHSGDTPGLQPFNYQKMLQKVLHRGNDTALKLSPKPVKVAQRAKR